jgi:hypothetical protein
MRRTTLRRVTAVVIGFIVLFICILTIFRILSVG